MPAASSSGGSRTPGGRIRSSKTLGRALPRGPGATPRSSNRGIAPAAGPRVLPAGREDPKAAPPRREGRGGKPKPRRPPGATPPHGGDHRHHGPGWLVPGRAVARQRLRRGGRRASHVPRLLRADRAPARPREHRPRGPPGPALAHVRGTRRPAGRSLQPGRPEFRPHVLDPARVDRRVHGARRDAAARGRPPRAPDGAVLPGELVRDVRQGSGDAAARDDALLPALALRRGQGVRPLDHGQLPGVLRPVRRQRHPLQPRVPPARARVRRAQGDGRRRPHREGEGAGLASRQSRCQAGLGVRRRLRGRHVAHAAASPPGRLRDRDGRDALGPRAVRAGLFARGPRLAEVRHGGSALRAAGGGGYAAGRPEQSASRAGLGAADELRRAGAYDGRRRRGATVVKVLVTGADGFVGRWLLRRLLADGREVYGAVRPGQSPPPVAPAADLTPAERDAVRWLPLELTDADSVRRAVDLPYDAVVHLAAVSSGVDATRDSGFAWTVNAAGTARIVQVLAEAKRVGRADPVVLVVSTGEVYGACAEQRPRRETDPVVPSSPYAASKAGAELAALEAWRRAGLRVVVARAFAHTGPGQDARFVVPAFAERLRFAKRVGAPVVKVGNLETVQASLNA